MKEYKESRLKNGLTVITSEDNNSDIVTFSACIRSGSRYEGEGEIGYAHILEHMLLKGTKSKPSIFDLNIVFDRAGAYSNASTSNEILKIIIQVSAENFEEIFSVFADIIMNPEFDEGILDNEKKVIMQEIKRANDNHPTRLWIESLKKVFRGHPLANYPLGTDESVNASNSEKLFNFHKKFFCADNIAIIACGNISHEELEKKCKEKFGQIKTGELNEESLKKSRNKSVIGFEKMAGNQTYVMFNFLGSDVNLKDSLVLGIISNYLGYKHTSLLYQELRHKKGFIYSVSVYNTAFRDANLFCISTSTTNPKEVIGIVLDKVLVLDKYFTESIFEEYKKQFINVLLRQMSDPFNEMNYLCGYWNLYNRLITPREIIEVINNLKYEDMIAVKNKYLTKDNLFIMTIGEENINIDL